MHTAGVKKHLIHCRLCSLIKYLLTQGKHDCLHSQAAVQQPKGQPFVSDLWEPASPQVMAFHISEEGERQKLVCFASNFFPKHLDIHWSMKGTDVNCSSDPLAPVALGDGKFQKSCSLVLSREDWSKPEVYTCTVNHSSTNTLVKKSLHSSGRSQCAEK